VPLGIHGVVLRSADPAALARRWTELTGMEPFRRSRREIVLGGPELFVIVRKGRADAVEELHLAVKKIAAGGRRTRPDPLGGDSWEKSLGAFSLIVREFRRPPSARWRKTRRR
jgi:hypothetical protein